MVEIEVLEKKRKEGFLQPVRWKGVSFVDFDVDVEMGTII